MLIRLFLNGVILETFFDSAESPDTPQLFFSTDGCNRILAHSSSVDSIECLSVLLGLGSLISFAESVLYNSSKQESVTRPSGPSPARGPVARGPWKNAD